MPRAPLSGELAKPTGFDREVFPGQSSVKAAVQVLLSAEDVSRKALCEYRFNQRSTGDSPAAVVLLLDIPRGWKPRAKQQPTGLIACGAAHRRPVQVLLSAEDVSRKALCEYRFNQRSTGDSPAAVVLLLDIPRGWKPRAKQQPTGLIACGAAHRRPVQVLLSADRKFPKGLRVKEKRQPF